MAAKPRKSVVQNIIKNLLEMEIPEIQTASKELAEWIKQLEQHSFKLQHYATEIENWASEEEEVDSIELTDLIKDLEATLTDMRKGQLPAPLREQVDSTAESTEKMLRGYGISGRVLKGPKAAAKAEIRTEGDKTAVGKSSAPKTPTDEPLLDAARTPEGVLIAEDEEKPKAKPELPTGGKQLARRDVTRVPAEEDAKGYVTPEGFLIRRVRP